MDPVIILGILMALVPIAVSVLRYFAPKTATKWDDKIVELIDANELDDKAIALLQGKLDQAKQKNLTATETDVIVK